MPPACQDSDLCRLTQHPWLSYSGVMTTVPAIDKTISTRPLAGMIMISMLLIGPAVPGQVV